jgi:protein TonB
VTAYRGAPPDKVAVAPPLPPVRPNDDSSSPPLTAGNALVLGAQAAPDRGPGQPAASRGAFFQQLTTHLFMVNQQVLAEAIRATPRLTVEVRFTIDRSGRVLGAQVMNSTGDAALDLKAAEVILRASPVPQLAPDMPQPRIELSFPVQIYR